MCLASALCQRLSLLICSSPDNLNWPAVMIQTRETYRLVTVTTELIV